MRRLLITLLLAAALLALLVAPPLAGATATCQPSVITTFPTGIPDWGSFAESMAADSHGNLYVSITYFAEDTNTGQLWRISPDGRKKLMASMDVTAVGVLTGVAIDACDRVYVGVWDFSFEDLSNRSPVYRLDREKLTQVVALPSAACRTDSPSTMAASTSPTARAASGESASVRAWFEPD